MIESLDAFYSTDSFRDGVLTAVNLGDDADTTAAIYGQLAGAYYGVDALPDYWLSQLARVELIEKFALRLLTAGDSYEKSQFSSC